MPSTSFKNLLVENWGLVPYRESFEKQSQYVDEIISGFRQPTLVFTQHSPVVTLGRGTKEGDLFAWKGAVESVNRGGRATYHGPNQMVFYPLIHLDPRDDPDFPCRKDIHGFIRLLENATVETIKSLGIESQGNVAQKSVGEDSQKDATGVWVAGKKIASIGIAIKKWISSHGLALNLYHDPQAFQGIHPCGFLSTQMTSVEKELGFKVDRSEIQKSFLKNFSKQMNFANQ